MPDVWTQAVFLNEELLLLEVAQRSGLFTLGPKEDLETVSSLAVLAEYTVLAPDALTNDPRAYFRAIALDPTTHEPLPGQDWEGIFHLDRDGVVLMSDIRLPAQYTPLVAPAWLASGWSITPVQDLPHGPIRPGHRWQTVRPLDSTDGVPAYSLPQVTVEGMFAGWTAPEGYFRTAVIKETFSGDLHTTDEIGDALLLADVYYEIEGEQVYRLQPGGFPDSATRTLEGVMQYAVGPESGAPPGLSGEVTLDVYFERSYVQQPVAPFPWLSEQLAAQGAYDLFDGVPVHGYLGASGEKLSDGTYVDYYSFLGRTNERVEIRLDSWQFDAYLFLADNDWNVLSEDNDSGSGTNAVIRYVLPYTGTYNVAATVPSAAQEDFGMLTAGAEVHGTLQQGAFILDDNTLVDIYLYEAAAGEQVTVVIRSNQFQPYVFITDITGMFLAGDDNPGPTEATVTFTFPDIGYYGIVANAAVPGQTGAYSVVVLPANSAGSVAGFQSEAFGVPGSSVGGVATGQQGAADVPSTLQPDWPVHGTIEPNQPIQDRVGGPDDSYRTYTLDVPADATQVVFVLESSVDVDMFVRHGAPMGHWGTDPDFQAMGSTGYEEITISTTTNPPLAAGTYFVDVANLYTGPGGAFTLMAHVETGARGEVGAKGAPVKGAPAKGMPGTSGTPGIAPTAPSTPPATPGAGTPSPSGTTSPYSGGSWRHPFGYFQIHLPDGFAKMHDEDEHAVTIFGPQDGNELLIVFNVPDIGLPLDVTAAQVPELLQLVGPFQMLAAGFQVDPSAGPGVYAADAHIPGGAFARTYLKQSGDMIFVMSAIVPTQADFKSRAAVYAAAVQSLQSTYRVTDVTGGQRHLIGRWERASSGSGSSGDFSGARTTVTFYEDGSVERYSVHVVSLPGYGSSQSTEQTPGAYVVLGNIMFLFWKTDTGVSADMALLQATANELYLDNTYYRRVD